jgi:rubrerythrin
LTFAIDLEGATVRFYEAAAKVGGDLADTFENYARRSAKRQQRLTAIRQDNITEIVLEPISGLNVGDYDISGTQPTDRQQALGQALELESRVKQFYLDAGPKLNVTEPRRAFQKMAQENDERLAELKTAQG